MRARSTLKAPTGAPRLWTTRVCTSGERPSSTRVVGAISSPVSAQTPTACTASVPIHSVAPGAERRVRRDTLPDMSFGDTQLVHRDGAANLLKPLGLFFPVSMAIIAFALANLGHRWPAALVLAASIAWPIAHIGDIAALAVAVNVALVVGFGSLAWPGARRS